MAFSICSFFSVSSWLAFSICSFFSVSSSFLSLISLFLTVISSLALDRSSLAFSICSFFSVSSWLAFSICSFFSVSSSFWALIRSFCAVICSFCAVIFPFCTSAYARNPPSTATVASAAAMIFRMVRRRARWYSPSKEVPTIGARIRYFSFFSFFRLSARLSPRTLAASGSRSFRFPFSSVSKRSSSGKLSSGSPSTSTASTRSRPLCSIKYSSSRRHHLLCR